MLTHVELTNYRGFKSYRMEGLTPVNLLVGKNNSGKTTLLEGIQFLISGGDPGVLAEIAYRRGELIATPSDPSRSVDIIHFFHGHSFEHGCRLRIAGDNGFSPVTAHIASIEIKAAASAVHSEGGSQRTDALKIEIEGGAASTKRDVAVFALSREGGVEIEILSRASRRATMRPRADISVRFIGTESLDTLALAAMWDEVVLNGLEGEVRDALQILEKDVESVYMLTGIVLRGGFLSGPYSGLGRQAGVVVGLKGQSNRIPLGSLGDGMRRMLALATAIACLKEGSLFVDEIDTGFHYSVMSNMWELVVKRALASNVQVFATTHSWDCIEGLSALCQRLPEVRSQVSIHKIDREIPRSVAFAGDAIVQMVKADIDPR